MCSHFFFCTYAQALACNAGALQATCLRHVLCVVVTERRGVGCTLLSQIVLILLNDYWLRPESESTCMENMQDDIPPATKQTRTSYV